MDMDFAIPCPLVRPGLPHIRFPFVGSRFCSTLPSDGPSRFRPCALLVLHLHQVAQGTCTPRTPDMPGTHGLRPPQAAREARAIDSLETSEAHASMRSTARRVAERGRAASVEQVWSPLADREIARFISCPRNPPTDSRSRLVTELAMSYRRGAVPNPIAVIVTDIRAGDHFRSRHIQMA
jgi:hypothetical protein